MKKIFSEVFNKSLKSPNNPPLHFASYYYLDKEYTRKNRVYHNYSSSEEAEEDYQQITKNKKNAPLIEITSESLKTEYLKNVNFLNNGLNTLFIISFLYLIDTFINLKYLGPTGFNLALLIITCISISILILLFINIKIKIILDPYAYVIFYLFSMIESIILISLYFLKMINFVLVFKRLNGGRSCRNKYSCPGYFAYLLILVFSIIIFMGIFGCIKFTFLLFLEAFKILSKKKKTFFQRQIEINENSGKNGKIEFVDEKDSINNSKNHLNSNDILKIE